MLENIDFYYFSPTGGTKKAGEMILSIKLDTISSNKFQADSLRLS